MCDVPPAPDLTSCDQEPIAHLERIQNFGFLLALSNDDWTIVRASANLETFLGVSPEAAIGTRLDRWIGLEAQHALRNRLSALHASTSERLYDVRLSAGKPSFDLGVHSAGDLLIIEGEPSCPDDRLEAASTVRTLFTRLDKTDTLDAFHRLAARQIRAITGFDRVMIYRFAENGDGCVIAESTAFGVESFLGLHYPASDIPSQARALYLRNPFRIIADVGADTVPLLPRPRGALQPLDLSLAITRAVSPVHIEYLRNMGVGSSMSISIIVGGQLWGLAACHNRTPRLPTFVVRTAVEIFGAMYSMALESRLSRHAAAGDREARELVDRLVSEIAGNESLISDATWLHAMLRKMIDCDGVATYRGNNVFTYGSTPDDADIRLLAAHLNAASPNKVFATEHLAALHVTSAGCMERAAGMLAIPLSRIPGDYLMLFRRERLHEIRWGGDPAKPVEPSDSGSRISPRKSFKTFMQAIKGRASPFSSDDGRIGETIRTALIRVLLRCTSSDNDEWRRTTERQEVLIAELNHRVRNILTLMRGLISQTASTVTDVASYVESLGDRVQALARAHDQVTRQDWSPAPLMDLFDGEIAAHGGTARGRLLVQGPAVKLQPHAVSSLALVIHELLTNSIKHGALSQSGRVQVTIEVKNGEGLYLRWREHDGPTVQTPKRRGFGSVIVERTVPYDLQGTADVRYQPAGLEADFFIPQAHISQELPGMAPSTAFAAALGPDAPSGVVSKPLGGLRVLLVEDSMIMALEAEEMLSKLGAVLVISAATLTEADDAISKRKFDLAVLDISVGPGTSFGIAARLRQIGVPYIFASGYGDRGIPKEHRSAAVVPKPYEREKLERTICTVLAGTTRSPRRQPLRGDLSREQRRHLIRPEKHSPGQPVSPLGATPPGPQSLTPRRRD